MMKIFKIFTRAWFIHLLITIILIAVLWLWGNLISVANYAVFKPIVTKVIISAILVLLFVLMHMRLKSTTKTTTNSSATTIATEDTKIDEQKINGEQLRLLSLFKDIKKYLNKHKFANLPWYFVTGTVDSGKTTLLQKSTLKFINLYDIPTQTKELTCHITEEAVFVEIKGEQLDDIKPNLFWRELFSTLKNRAIRNSFRGVITTYSISDLCSELVEEKQRTNTILQARLRDINQHMRHSLPLYLLLTQFDKIVGFQEFFANLSDIEKEQLWGLDCQHLKNSDQVLAQYQQFINPLVEKVVFLSHQPNRKVASAYIANFPLQLTALKKNLAALLDCLLTPSNHHAPLALQNLFFTSAKQTGIKHDVISQSIVTDFGLKSTIESDNKPNNSSYFISRIIPHIITNRKLKTSTQLNFANSKLAFAYGILLLITLGVTAYSYYSFQSNQQQIAKTTKLLQNYVANNNAADDTLYQIQNLQALHDSAANNWLARLGFNQGNSLHQLTENFYQAKLTSLVMPWLVNSVGETILQANNDPGKLYQALKAYLMLGYPTHRDNSFLQPWLLQNLAQQDGKTLLQQIDLASILKTVLTPNIAGQLNAQLITTARVELQQLPAGQLAFLMLSSSPAANQLRPTIINNALIPGFNQVFTSNKSLIIPGLYTPVGYRWFTLNKLSLLGKQVADDWVIGANDNSLQLQQLEQQVNNYYFSAYLASWQQMLQQIKIVPIKGINANNSVLTAITQVPSPLTQLLMLITNNTNVLPKNITNTLMPVQQTVMANKNDPNALSNIVNNLTALKTTMGKLSAADDGGKLFYNTAAALMNDASQSPFILLKQQAASEPAPINQWLNYLVNTSTAFVISNTLGYLDNLWQKNVYTDYTQAISGLYPFNKNASSEVALADFASVFGPKGDLNNFYQKYLSPFVSVNGQLLQSQNNLALSLPLPVATLNAIKTSQAIKNVYFSTAGKPQLSLSLQAINMDANLTQAQLNISNKTLSYRHDPQQPTTISWPETTDKQQILLTLFNVNGQRSSLSETGTWNLFHLFDNCKLQYQSSTQTLMSCAVGKQNVTYQLTANSVINLFTIASLSNFTLPQQLSSN